MEYRSVVVNQYDGNICLDLSVLECIVKDYQVRLREVLVFAFPGLS